MKRFRNTIFYIFTIGIFSALMYWIVVKGADLEAGRNIGSFVTGNSSWQEFKESFSHNLQYPLSILLLQIIIIIMTARIFGWICNKMGQPAVIGEIIAGIVLGPSLLGMYFPEFSAAIFPPQSLGNIQFLSHIGLVLFMFVVGMEIDLKVLKSKAHDAIVISHASIIIPFALGMGLAYFIYLHFAPAGVKFSSFGLFLGIAMSITAFPVLARIVQERGINKTKLGTIVITCAAADDITAWCLLAVVIAIVKAGTFSSALFTVILAVLYVFLMIKVVKPFLKRVGEIHSSDENLSKSIVAIFFLTLIASSYATEVIGIHALFGAFMAGAIMPDNARFRNIFIEKVEDVALVLLLPLFFVYTGLRTQIGLLNEPYLWGVTAAIILVAVAGKFIGSAFAAKFVGQNWKNSLVIGALMNTRGLMELVVLNIGYDLGVLTPEIFAMMVIMALVTTFMTGPALSLFDRIFKAKDNKHHAMEPTPKENELKVLISFGNPERGKSLLKLAYGLAGGKTGRADITALHLTPAGELHHYNEEHFEQKSFEPIREESKKLNKKINTIFKVSSDIEGDITGIGNKNAYDLLLIGVGQSIFEGSFLGGIFGLATRVFNLGNLINQVAGKRNLFEGSAFDERTRAILSKSKIPVGILIDKGLSKIHKIFVPIFDDDDFFLLQYVERFASDNQYVIQIFDATGEIANQPVFKKLAVPQSENVSPRIALVGEQTVRNGFLSQQNLVLISVAGWKNLMEKKSPWLVNMPSTLILKN